VSADQIWIGQLEKLVSQQLSATPAAERLGVSEELTPPTTTITERSSEPSDLPFDSEYFSSTAMNLDSSAFGAPGDLTSYFQLQLWEQGGMGSQSGNDLASLTYTTPPNISETQNPFSPWVSPTEDGTSKANIPTNVVDGALLSPFFSNGSTEL